MEAEVPAEHAELVECARFGLSSKMGRPTHERPLKVCVTRRLKNQFEGTRVDSLERSIASDQCAHFAGLYIGCS